MEKAGFAYERDIVHVGLPHVLYRRIARRTADAPLLALRASSRQPL